MERCRRNKNPTMRFVIEVSAVAKIVVAKIKGMHTVQCNIENDDTLDTLSPTTCGF